MNTPSQPPNLILGTAGHVDHGKTALIERLTGINADRLQEERDRGLTIDLGFAWLRLPSGAWAGIVDVPGHERFVKNMLAGATGIDLFLLVVAADEGVMPQTREHLTILKVLEIEAGIVVITKSDLVEPEMLELVKEDIAEALKGTVFEKAPTVAVSSKTGAGIEELLGKLEEVAAQVRPRDIAGPARMQIDRSFTVKGFGTVVTGSLIRGRLALDQELEVAPRGLRTRVRGLEVYGEHVQEVVAPCRVGVNVASLSREEVVRGDQLIAPGSMSPSWMLDVRVRLSAEAQRPLVYRERVHVHHGAAELLGRVVLLEAEQLLPGEEGLAQLRLEAPAVAATGDHFVLRRYSPPYAIGGGVILDPRPTRHRRREEGAIERLLTLESGTSADHARDWIRSEALRVFGVRGLASGLQLDPAEAQQLVEALRESGAVSELASGRFVDSEEADGLLQAIQEALAEYHEANPLRASMPLHHLQRAVGNPAPEVMQWALGVLRKGELIVAESGGWRSRGHEPRVEESQRALLRTVIAEAEAAAKAPPMQEQVLARLGGTANSRALLELAVSEGDVVLIGDFVMGRRALEQAVEELAELYRRSGAFGVSEVRDLWGSSRKYVVPILEHLDGAGVTRREGDRRHFVRLLAAK